MEEMTDKEILQKAIEMAEENGMDKFLYLISRVGGQYIDKQGWIYSWHGVIFSHDFAKAFFTECTPIEVLRIRKDTGRIVGVEIKLWQYHLQQMVLEVNPINYLRKFVNTENSK